jgi:hypothetical protein
MALEKAASLICTAEIERRTPRQFRAKLSSGARRMERDDIGSGNYPCHGGGRSGWSTSMGTDA